MDGEYASGSHQGIAGFSPIHGRRIHPALARVADGKAQQPEPSLLRPKISPGGRERRLPGDRQDPARQVTAVDLGQREVERAGSKRVSLAGRRGLLETAHGYAFLAPTLVG